MKRLIIMVILLFAMLGCSTKDTYSPPEKEKWKITNITQGYGNYDSIEGVLTNTGNTTMTDIIIVAMVGDKVLMGTVEKEVLYPQESAEFIITSTIGAGDIRNTEIQYRVYCDTE